MGTVNGMGESRDVALPPAVARHYEGRGTVLVIEPGSWYRLKLFRDLGWNVTAMVENEDHAELFRLRGYPTYSGHVGFPWTIVEQYDRILLNWIEWHPDPELAFRSVKLMLAKDGFLHIMYTGDPDLETLEFYQAWLQDLEFVGAACYIEPDQRFFRRFSPRYWPGRWIRIVHSFYRRGCDGDSK